MARMTQREADEFRRKIKSILAEPQHWGGYEEQRRWLQKLLQREEKYYTRAERKAVQNIAFARTPFRGWAGFSVPELARGALRYAADFGYDDELFLREAERADQLVIGEMRSLVGLCIMAGMDIPRFNPGPLPSPLDDDAEQDRFERIAGIAKVA